MTQREFRALIQSHLGDYDLKDTRLALRLHDNSRARLEHIKTGESKQVEVWYHPPVDGDPEDVWAQRTADALAHGYHRWDYETPHMVGPLAGLLKGHGQGLQELYLRDFSGTFRAVPLLYSPLHALPQRKHSLLRVRLLPEASDHPE